MFMLNGSSGTQKKGDRQPFPPPRAAEMQAFVVAEKVSVPFFLACLIVSSAIAQNLPVTRLAGASFQVSDMDRVHQFYGGVLALPEAKGKDSLVYQLNDDQYLEFSPGAAGNFRLLHISMLTPDPARLAGMLAGRGVTVSKGDGYISISDPERNEIRFMRPTGRKAPAAGGFSDHLLHVGVNSDHESESMALYRDKLNFRELQRGGPSPAEIRWIILNMPETPGDWVEVMIAKAQPAAARQHICFEVTDTRRTYKDLTSRGLPDRNKPFPAQNNRMIMNLRDPNGLRVEIMGEKTK